MTEPQLQSLVTQLNQELSAAELIETHISWVILTDTFVYKFKKPVHFSFLDFSTLGKRKYYCERELELNSRLTEGVYLQVLPVRQTAQGLEIGGDRGEIIDYTLQMKRLDTSRQMHELLENGVVTEHHMEQIARQLAVFHRETDVVDKPVEVEAHIAIFLDFRSEIDFIEQQMDAAAGRCLRESCDFVTDFLHRHSDRLRERGREGFVVDGHGDLHSKNIFLLDQPVIFDCIEFSDELRRLDVLNEIAFFCLDLNYYGREDLEKAFLNCYLKERPCVRTDEDRRLFQYFKLYRANVRLKVSAMSAMGAENADERNRNIAEMKEYFQLFRKYYEVLQKAEKDHS